MRPQTKYAKSGDVSIAYQALGDGPFDLVLVHGFVSHLELAWEEPHLAQFLNRLASFSRLILFDKRGTGLSDPVAEPPTFPQRMDDIRAVMDAVGSERAALLGVSEGGPLSIVFTCTYPERTQALIAYGSYARWREDVDYPWGRTPEQYTGFLEGIARAWDTGEWWIQHNPTALADERYRRWWASYLRAAASPGMATALVKMNSEIDVRDVLPGVQVPTLILHRTNEQWFEVGNARYLAQRIPGSRLVELPGVDHVPWVGDAEAMLREVELFLTGTHKRRRSSPFAIGPDALTHREREVVHLAIAGHTAIAIAKRLYISDRTVETHLANAYIKLGVASRVELARRADALGI
ncbi:MAG: alpha/beta fold hydrolase [Candidatus Dormibacteraeota bacterium]|nr:alpha/beta fold hydrolase [Candidatus Dormibacteraeota bacterium]